MHDSVLLGQMADQAQKGYPKEACGLIVSKHNKAMLFECKNISPEPATQFILDPVDYAKAEDAGEIVAIWHSHVEEPSTPSDADRAGCEASELPWFISAIRKTPEGFHVEQPTLLEPTGFLADYIGRPYVFGSFDCWSLVVDYYKREFEIALPSLRHQRIADWWEKGLDFFEDGTNSEIAEDFIAVTDDSYKVGDLIMFSINAKVTNHIAIYAGDDIILHHSINRLSRRETYGTFWSKFKTHHFRHRSKC